ncbi:MAG: hypothetical protein MZV64_60390 [Ignavibacteriales bacterium]|nr:hypothetical protein [Ignavibacteriales bacterium]
MKWNGSSARAWTSRPADLARGIDRPALDRRHLHAGHDRAGRHRGDRALCVRDCRHPHGG